MTRFKVSRAASRNESNGTDPAILQRSLRFCVLAGWFVALSVQTAAAQGALDLRLRVDAGGRARTETFSILPIEELSIELVEPIGDREPLLNIYIHDEHGMLVDRDDPDTASDRFRWQPSTTGRYYIVLDNTGAGAATVRLRTTRGTRALPSSERPTAAPFATVRVWFATDRRDDGKPSQPLFGSKGAADLSYGYSDVSLPREHRFGELEGPSILKLEFRADASKHVVLQNVQSQSERAFREQLATRIAASRRKEVLLFVHGFNVAFDDAVRRTAQIAYDLAFDGPAVTFSDLSAASLKKVLELLTSSDEVTVHVIANGVGSRVVASALEQPAAARGLHRGGVREVAFIAPEIDAALLKRIAGQIAGNAARITLYASSREQLIVVPDVQTIDTSGVDTSLIGLSHSYYADHNTILSDLFTLLKGQAPQDRSGLTPIATANGTYWKFRPGP